jgi:hypothetical protein
MGKQRDKNMRTKKPRVDDEERRFKVEVARRRIYKEGLVVNSTYVEDILKPQSLVPTVVRRVYYSYEFTL